MTFSENWRLINDFSHDEAAALWCGLDPGPSAFSHPDVMPVKRFIEDKHIRWKIAKDVEHMKEQWRRPFNTPLSIDEIQRDARAHSIQRTTTVSRQWLTELALSMGVRPAFLFDQQVADSVPEMSVTPVQIMTGAPGRPSSMHLIEAEFDRRNSINQFENTLAEEARHLLNWFSSNHAGRPSPTEKTISNRLRGKYKAARPKL